MGARSFQFLRCFAIKLRDHLSNLGLSSLWLKCLASRLQVTEHEKVERTIIKAPAGKANLPSTLFETSGYELTVGLLSQAASSGMFQELCGNFSKDFLSLLP